MKDVAEDALEALREQEPDDAVVKTVKRRDRQARFSESQIDVVKTLQDRDIHIYAVWDQAVVTTTVKDPAEVADAAKRLRSTARRSDPNPNHAGIAEGPFDYAYRQRDASLDDVDPAETARDAIQAAEDAGADHAAGAVYVRSERTALATTGECLASEPWSGIELSLRAFQGDATGHKVQCATRLDDIDPTTVGEQAARFAELGQDPDAADGGEHRVLFEPMFFATLLDKYVTMTSAFHVATGMSVFEPDDVGSQVASEKVTLADDPDDRRGLGHRAFDDEGRPTRRVPLIEDGQLTTLLHNTSTAEMLGSEPTASAGLIAPEPSCIQLQPGDVDRSEALEVLGDGLWLTNAWYTRFQNRTTGDFSALPRDAALEVEDGEVTGALTGLRLADNLADIMQRVDALGDEQEQIKWWAETTTPTFTPQVIVDDVGFTTSAV